jgi:ParB family chromosome partitioning protein
MPRRGGLGRGLESLIPRSSALADGDPGEASALDSALRARLDRFRSDEQLPYREIPLELIDANPRQPRGTFDEEALAELTASIQAVGILQPVVVRPAGDRYQLIMGERRMRAATAAGLRAIPAVLRETSDQHLLRDALVENIHREDLNPLEEAAAYEQLLADFGVSHEELARRLGKSRPAITNALRLLRLPAAVQRRLAAGTISAGHARALLTVEDTALQSGLAERIVAEGLTVRQTEEMAKLVATGALPISVQRRLLTGNITAGHAQLLLTLDDADLQERLAERIVAEGLTVRQAEELITLLARGHDVMGDQRPAPQPQRTRIQAPGLAELADRLSDRLDTRVKVQMGKQKGKVLIEFATLDDLQRICDAIGLDGHDGEMSSHSSRP